MALKVLDGCKGCERKCQFNRPVAGEGVTQSKTLYPCNSRVAIASWSNELAGNLWRSEEWRM